MMAERPRRGHAGAATVRKTSARFIAGPAARGGLGFGHEDDQRAGVDIEALTAEIDHRLKDADAALARDYPGERAGRQPVHTVYVPADQVEPELLASYGNQAQMSIVENGAEFLDVLGR